MAHIQDLLTAIGLESDRAQMFNMSAAMASAFVTVAQEMTERIARLGPNPLRGPLDTLTDSERGE